MKSLAEDAVIKEILHRIAKLHANAPAQWGRMSVGQMICHLSDSFLLSMGEKSASTATSIFHRTFMKWGALYVPFRWPKGFRTRPEIEQGVGGTPPTQFERDRMALAAIVERFSNPQRDFRWEKHPIFGTMSDREWMRWGYLHTDHHLRQFGA